MLSDLVLLMTLVPCLVQVEVSKFITGTMEEAMKGAPAVAAEIDEEGDITDEHQEEAHGQDEADEGSATDDDEDDDGNDDDEDEDDDDDDDDGESDSAAKQTPEWKRLCRMREEVLRDMKTPEYDPRRYPNGIIPPYEKQRLKNMAANEAVRNHLDFTSIKQALASGADNGTGKKPRERKPRPTPGPPTRRSSRLETLAVVAGSYKEVDDDASDREHHKKRAKVASKPRPVVKPKQRNYQGIRSKRCAAKLSLKDLVPKGCETKDVLLASLSKAMLESWGPDCGLSDRSVWRQLFHYSGGHIIVSNCKWMDKDGSITVERDDGGNFVLRARMFPEDRRAFTDLSALRKDLHSRTVHCILYSTKYSQYRYYGQLEQPLVEEDSEGDIVWVVGKLV